MTSKAVSDAEPGCPALIAPSVEELLEFADLIDASGYELLITSSRSASTPNVPK